MFNLGGTYRACRPEETLAKIEPMLWEQFGITRVANITGLDNINISTYIAIRPTSKHLSASQGKGITPDLAKISAMMESIEGWHAEQAPIPDLFGSMAQLEKKHSLVDLKSLSTLAVNISEHELRQIEMPWLKAIDLISSNEIYLPLNCVHIDFTSHLSDGIFVPTSNGLASGNTFEEAVCHGVYEVIERHCHSQYTNDLVIHHIDTLELTSPHLKQLIEQLNQKELRLDLVNITDNINVPSFLATITDLTHVHAVGAYFGSGTHLSAEVAISRAITEAIQSRLTFISGSRDNLYPSVYNDVHRNAIYDIKKRDSTPLKLNPLLNVTIPNNFTQCIQELLHRLKHAGFNQVIVFNHTKADIDIPVVHVFIPGLIFDKQKHLNYAYSADNFLLGV